MHYDGKTWTHHFAGCTWTSSTYMPRDGKVWAAAAVMHFDGSQWSKLTRRSWPAARCSGSGATAQPSGSGQHQGSHEVTWLASAMVPGPRAGRPRGLTLIDGSSDQDIWALSRQDQGYRYDGKTWTRFSTSQGVRCGHCPSLVRTAHLPSVRRA